MLTMRIIKRRDDCELDLETAVPSAYTSINRLLCTMLSENHFSVLELISLEKMRLPDLNSALKELSQENHRGE